MLTAANRLLRLPGGGGRRRRAFAAGRAGPRRCDGDPGRSAGARGPSERRNNRYSAALPIAPDLVWLVDGEVWACIDVKYKVEKHGQYPNADLYQMATYCRRFGLKTGHLVYAAGESQARRVQVIDGPLVHRHALDLSRPMEAVLGQLSSFGRQGSRSEGA